MQELPPLQLLNASPAGMWIATGTLAAILVFVMFHRTIGELFAKIAVAALGTAAIAMGLICCVVGVFTICLALLIYVVVVRSNRTAE